MTFIIEIFFIEKKNLKIEQIGHSQSHIQKEAKICMPQVVAPGYWLDHKCGKIKINQILSFK